MRITRGKVVEVGVVFLALVLLAPSAWAQQASGIAGVARDTSGGVLPGVTVEAASPALIEKVRTGVTDSEGRFTIPDLRPGTYVVTFSLAGFNTYKREGIQLPGGFTATVNADMQVGALEETITVTGAAPLVDTQNARSQAVLSNESLSALPSSVKAMYSVAAFIPGMVSQADVGGSRGVSAYVGDSFHGKTNGQAKTTFDGMRSQNFQGVGNSFYIINSGSVAEMVMETGGSTAESIAGGFGMNLIPKEGGNTFTYGASGMFTNDRLQSDNLNQELRDRGLDTEAKVVKLFDLTGTFGGPIKRDRLWFFTSHRVWGNRNQVPGVYWNLTQGAPIYTPDLTRPWVRSQTTNSHATRLTWQVSPKNKIGVFIDPQKQNLLGSGAEFIAPEAVSSSWKFWPVALYQVTWNAPKTSRLLLEAGASATINHWIGIRPPGVLPTHISTLEQSTGFLYNNRANIGVGNSGNIGTDHTGDRYAQRFSMLYITGAHSFKVGFQLEEGSRNMETVIDGDRQYQLLRGVPVLVRIFATPQTAFDRMRADLGVYAQDQWRISRLTLNYGLRFNYFNAYVAEQHAPAAAYIGARDFAAIYKTPEWRDLDPRIGASFDVFGTGRTALKFALGRYVVPAGLDITGQVNPLVSSVNQVNRSWTDTNGNYVPDCDLRDPAGNGECGPFANQNFGKLNPTATTYADDVLRGYGVRGVNWDLLTEMQHEVRGGISVTAGYYRNWDGNFLATDNLSVTSADYSPYCITAPVDPRLPGGGGNQVCGLYDINPNKFGQVTNRVTQALNYGTQTRVNNFVAFSMDARFTSGARLSGGVDTGRIVTDNCFVVDSPQSLLYCHVVTPWNGNTQIKINGSQPLPRGFSISGVIQNVPSPQILANYPAPTALIAPSLGRNLAGGVRTATVPLIEPGTQYEKRRTQLDVRLSKSFDLGSRGRFQASFDVYNLLNANSVVSRNNTFGSTWGRPASILDGRLIEFSGQLNF